MLPENWIDPISKTWRKKMHKRYKFAISKTNEIIGIQYGRHFMARIQQNTVQNHRQGLIFLKRRCVHEFVEFLREGTGEKQNILGPSTRRDLSISASIERFPNGFKKVFRTNSLMISGFSVWAMWNTLLIANSPSNYTQVRSRI